MAGSVSNQPCTHTHTHTSQLGRISCTQANLVSGKNKNAATRVDHNDALDAERDEVVQNVARCRDEPQQTRVHLACTSHRYRFFPWVFVLLLGLWTLQPFKSESVYGKGSSRTRSIRYPPRCSRGPSSHPSHPFSHTDASMGAGGLAELEAGHVEYRHHRRPLARVSPRDVLVHETKVPETCGGQCDAEIPNTKVSRRTLFHQRVSTYADALARVSGVSKQDYRISPRSLERVKSLQRDSPHRERERETWKL